MKRLQAMGSLDIWYMHAYVDRTSPLLHIDAKTQAIVAKAAAKARAQTNVTLFKRLLSGGMVVGNSGQTRRF